MRLKQDRLVVKYNGGENEMTNTEFKTIRVTKIECDDGTNKNGKPFKRWKVYDEDGMYFSGFKDPELEQGQVYSVAFTRSGENQQFLNYQKFTKTDEKVTPPASQQSKVSTWADRDKARTARIELMHLDKVAAELTNIAFRNEKSIDSVVQLYKEALRQLKLKEIPVEEVKFENE